MDFSAVARDIVDGQVEVITDLRSFVLELFVKPASIGTVHMLTQIVETLAQLLEAAAAECSQRQLDFVDRSEALEPISDAYLEALLRLRWKTAKLPGDCAAKLTVAHPSEQAECHKPLSSEGDENEEEKSNEDEKLKQQEQDEEEDKTDPQKEEELPPKKSVGEQQRSPSSINNGGAGRAPITPSVSKSPSRKPRCFYCDELHELYRCRPYQLLPNEERLRLVDVWQLCLNCFSPRHGALKCWKDPRCDFCKPKQYHHPELHHGLRDAGRL